MSEHCKHIKYLVGPSLGVIRAFTQASILEMYFFETSLMRDLWCQTCIIRSIKATFVVKTISDILFRQIISKRLNGVHVWTVLRTVKNLQILRSQKVLNCFCSVERCKVVYECTIIHCWGTLFSSEATGDGISLFYIDVVHIPLNKMKFTFSKCRDGAPYHNLYWVLDSALETFWARTFHPVFSQRRRTFRSLSPLLKHWKNAPEIKICKLQILILIYQTWRV